MGLTEPSDVDDPTVTILPDAHRLRRKGPWRKPFVLGEEIDGAYRIDGVLGAGGMSVVYLAHDMRLGRDVALKTSNDARHVPMLLREAQALAAVRHPGVVSVHSMGRYRGHDYLVLERLLGRTLQSRIDSARLQRAAQRLRLHEDVAGSESEVVLSIDESIDIATGVCDALSGVHRAGLAHRDLKPSNVFVCGARVVLLDFGLFIPEYDVVSCTQTAGSVEYMAPEVIANTVQPGAGPLIDLYALGVMLFELLTGKTPFADAADRTVLRRHMSEQPPSIAAANPHVPIALAQLVEGLLQKDPADRIGSAEAVLWQLCAIRGDGGRIGVRPFRVLVVDDDPAIGALLSRSLKQALPQLVVEVENDAREALAEIERDRPDLVLLDLNMPHINGIELMMQVRTLPESRRPRVVGMSAEAREADVNVWRALGVVDFTAKDVSFVPRIASTIADLRNS